MPTSSREDFVNGLLGRETMASKASNDYTVRQLARDVLELAEKYGADGPKLLAALRVPYANILARDLSSTGVKRQGNHIDNSKYL